jgi:hypothetical protein
MIAPIAPMLARRCITVSQFSQKTVRLPVVRLQAINSTISSAGRAGALTASSPFAEKGLHVCPVEQHRAAIVDWHQAIAVPLANRVLMDCQTVHQL